MAFAPHVNLLPGVIKTAPTPATTGDVFELMAGDGTRFQVGNADFEKVRAAQAHNV